MKRFIDLLKRILTMDYRNMIKTIYKIHKKSKLSYFYIIKDIINCAIKYQAGYMDYMLFEMYNLDDEQRQTVLTSGKNTQLIRKYNDPEYRYIFDDKGKFNVLFSDYLSRDWLVLDNNKYEFFNFIKDKKYVIAKPRCGTCGKGVEKIDVDCEDELYKYLEYENITLIEDVIKQNEIMNKLCANSVNTIRIVSLLNNEKVNIVAAYLRIGNGNIVDNFNSGGMVVPIDIKTGIINDVAIDKNGKTYTKHPITNTDIIGFKIPMWKQVIKMVEELSVIVPQVRLVGWDIAIGEKKPVLVEGNDFPGNDIYQLPAHTKDGIGLYPKFVEIK